HLDVDVHVQVAAAAHVQPAHAQALLDHDGSGLGARRDVHLDRSVERVELDDGAERGRGHRHGERAVQVVAAPHERLVRALADLEVHVPRRAAAWADLALARELDARAGVHARGDVDREGAAAAHAAVARALRARVGDHGAEPLARPARARRHDLAQERPRDALDDAAAPAHLARARRGPRAAAAALARRADDGRVDLDLAARAEDGV